jgi:hypothetical protein
VSGGVHGTVAFNNKVVLMTEDPYPEGSFVFLEHRIENKASLIVVAERSSAPSCEYRKIHFILIDASGTERTVSWDGECLGQDLSKAFHLVGTKDKWHSILVDSEGIVSTVDLWKSGTSRQ